ncbi:hypothetical protein BJH93_02725 [Kocuria polaris]|nr:hypothetical protein [Kocuria polaris]
MADSSAIAGETKDWSIVTIEGCIECGYSPHAGPTTGSRLRRTARSWHEVMGHPRVAQRPEPHVWSPLEYAAHTRDMCRLACERVALMLTRTAPTFSNWDQDEEAVINDYAHADPLIISADLGRQLERAARTFDDVPANSWSRSGFRGDGKAFTVETFASFVLHEIEHHLQDAEEGLRKHR